MPISATAARYPPARPAIGAIGRIAAGLRLVVAGTDLPAPGSENRVCNLPKSDKWSALDSDSARVRELRLLWLGQHGRRPRPLDRPADRQASALESRMSPEGSASEPSPATAQPTLPPGRIAAATARQNTRIAARKRVSQAALAAAVRELRTRRRFGMPPL